MKFTREMHLAATAAVMCCMMVLDVWMNLGTYSDPVNSTIIERMELCGFVMLALFLGLSLMYISDIRKSTLLLSIGVTMYSILYFTDFFFLEESEDIVVSAIALIINLMAVLSLGCVIGYALGYQHNITRLIMIYAAITGFMLVPWWVERYIFHDLAAAEETFNAWVPPILIMVSYIVYLLRGDIRDMSVGGQLKLRLARVESFLFIDNRAYMEKEEMDRMLGLTDEGWEQFSEGPVEKQCVVHITSPIGRRFEIWVKKWKGEDFFRAVVNTEPSNGYWGMQFDIVEHKDYEIGGNDIVRIYGHDGMFVDIYTDNPVIQKDNAVSRVLDKFHRQY